MNYLKYTQYIYLVFGLYFIYECITKIDAGEDPWLSLVIAALALFMFFFRRKFAKRFENRDKTNL